MLDTAAKMISLSDNTTADMLINLAGRSAVEAALTATGMASPAMNRPFLTTREIFVLKLDQWPALANRYIAADEPGRRALLAGVVDREPLPTAAAVGAWITPRDINPTSATLVRKSAGAFDRFEGLAEVVGDSVGGGDGVRAGLDLDGAVAAGGTDELAD